MKILWHNVISLYLVQIVVYLALLLIGMNPTAAIVIAGLGVGFTFGVIGIKLVIEAEATNEKK